MKYLIFAVTCGMLSHCHGEAQTASVVGTISAFKAEVTEIELKPDNGAPVSYKITGRTEAQQVVPGDSDLKSARLIRVTDLHLGDRVLATPEPGTRNLRRVIVMTASDLVRRDEADRADWAQRGVSGIVVTKSGDTLTLKLRTLTGEEQSTVKVNAKTIYRRYAPDSVRFLDATRSSLAEVEPGVQVRARGNKVPDGSIAAEEVVFGNFISSAGGVTSVDAAAGEITVKNATSGKPLIIRVTADSQLKRMLDRQAMIEMMHGPGGGAHPGGSKPAMMSLAAMMERLPSIRVEDVKPGDIVIVSSTRGAQPDRVTAISLLANAEMLLQVAAMMNGPRDSSAGPVSASASLELLSSMGFGVVQ